MTGAPPSVQVEQLVVERGGNEVLHGIDFQLHPGEVTGLLGPSGCGKSTLMRAIVGVQDVSSGQVGVFEHPAGAAGIRARVGYVTQAASVYDDLSIRENLAYFASMLGVGGERIDDVLDRVDLAGRSGQVVGSLSGGQRSRVSLAVALLGSPELLVLDEPTVGLDPELREQLWGTFAELADAGATLLVSSHVMEEAARCDRLLLMYEGRIVADTTPDELRSAWGSDDLDECFLRLIRAERQEDRP